MRVSSIIIFFVAFLCMVFLSFPVFASITGTVSDTNGDPVAGATVTFIDESNLDNQYSGITDDNGNYEIDLTTTAVEEQDPDPFSLWQNYPNPFNPTTMIPFTLESSDHVSLIIYNIMGQKIAAVIDNYISAGSHTVTWDGTDDHGNHVSAGIYLYQLKAGRYTETKKMLLLDGGVGSGVGASLAETLTLTTGIQSVAKTAEGTTYTVRITHDSIIPYEETGITVADGQTRDFVVSLIGDTPEWQTVFFDDFNRSDGDLGNDLSVEVYPAGTVEIVSNRLKISAAAEEHMMYAINYSEVKANVVRVSIICSTTTFNPSQEGYGLALTARGKLIDIVDNIPRQQYYSGSFGTISGDGSIIAPSIGISKSTIDGLSSLASKEYEIAENRSYKIVFTVNNKDLTLVVTDMVTAEEATLTATDQNPLTEGIVSLNGYQRNNLVLFIDDFKIEKYE